MKHTVTLSLIAACIINNAAAQDYLCIPTAAAGFTYKSSSKKWEHAFFRLDDKKIILKKTEDGYQWRDFGRRSGPTCADGFNEYDYLHCQTYFGSVIFNRKTLRYIETYLAGYHNGVDNNNDTPNITIGTCTPL